MSTSANEQMFKINKHRLDPYANFLFRVKFGKDYVAGVTKVGGLELTVQSIKHRQGGDPIPRVMPGQVEHSEITLERGVTHNDEFLAWANKMWSWNKAQKLVGGGGQFRSLGDYRRDITIELYNEAGQKVKAWNVYRCWVSKFTAISSLDSSANSVAIENLSLQHEGFVQDTSIKEVRETSYDDPKAS